MILIIAISIAFIAGTLFYLAARAVYAMWKTPTAPPAGHHFAKRNGKEFVRRNPRYKPKELVNQTGEQQ